MNIEDYHRIAAENPLFQAIRSEIEACRQALTQEERDAWDLEVYERTDELLYGTRWT